MNQSHTIPFHIQLVGLINQAPTFRKRVDLINLIITRIAALMSRVLEIFFYIFSRWA